MKYVIFLFIPIQLLCIGCDDDNVSNSATVYLTCSITNPSAGSYITQGKQIRMAFTLNSSVGVLDADLTVESVSYLVAGDELLTGKILI